MSECCDLFYLSALACQIARCVDQDELEILAANYTVLGDMLAAIAIRRGFCLDKLEEKKAKEKEEKEKEKECEDKDDSLLEKNKWECESPECTDD